MTENTDNKSQEETDQLGKVLRISQLLDLYGGLLTEKQRTFIRLHHEEDLSFGEIARQQGVSRQAIHDAAKHAEQSLERYEEQLGLLSRGFSRAKAPASEPTVPAQPELPADASAMREIAARLRELEGRIRKSGGVIYNGEGLARELGSLADDLEQAAG